MTSWQREPFRRRVDGVSAAAAADCLPPNSRQIAPKARGKECLDTPRRNAVGWGHRMSSFDQALTLVHDALSARKALKADRASLASLQRLLEATKEHGPAPAPTAVAAAQPAPKPAGAPSPAPVLQKPVFEKPAAPEPAPAAAPAPKGLSFAERVRAALAAKAATAAPAPAAPPAPASVAPAVPASEAPILPRRQKPQNLRERLDQLNAKVTQAYAGRAVLGRGGLHAILMIVGYGTGEAELAENQPVGGEAGVLLGKITAAMNLTAEELYITNLYKSPAPTTREEALAFLTEEIQIVRPKCIVTLGGETLETLVGEAGPIEEERGLWHAYKGTPVMPTFHPTHLIQNPAITEKRKLWEDMLQVLELLAKPISARQRGFFTQRG